MNKTKTILKFLATAFIVCSALTVGVACGNNQRSTIGKDKIVFEGLGNLSADSAVSEISDAVLQESNGIILSIVFTDGFVPETERPETETSENDIDAAIRSRREELSAHYFNANTEKFNSLGIDNYSDIYVSSYGPFVDLTLTKEEFVSDNCATLYTVAESKSVEIVYVKGYEEMSDD